MYESYRRDPASVDESLAPVLSRRRELRGGDAVADGRLRRAPSRKAAGAAPLARRHPATTAISPSQLDPLGTPPPGAAELEAGIPRHHRRRSAQLAGLGARSRRRRHGRRRHSADARPLLQRRSAYEFEHLSEETEREWFRAHDRIRRQRRAPLTPTRRRLLLQRLTEVDGLERFLGKAYVSVKRFSIEGVDALVPMLDEAIARGAQRRRARRRHRHGASRPAQRAHARHGQTVSRRCSRSSRAITRDTNAESDTGDVKYHMGYQRRARRSRRRHGGRRARAEPEPSRGRESGRRRRRARAPARAGGAPNARNEAQRAAARRSRRRVVPGRRRRSRDAQHVAAARLSRRRHAAHHREQSGRLHHRSDRRAVDALRERSREGLRHSDRARQRRRRRGVHSGRSSRHRVSRSGSARISSSTSSAIAVTATTRPTSRRSRSR